MLKLYNCEVCVWKLVWALSVHISANYVKPYPYFDGLAQDCSNSSALAMELLQSCTKPLNWQVWLQVSSTQPPVKCEHDSDS